MSSAKSARLIRAVQTLLPPPQFRHICSVQVGHTTMPTIGPSTSLPVKRLVGNLLKIARTRAGLPQREVAHQPMAQSAVTRIESGARQPSLGAMAEVVFPCESCSVTSVFSALTLAAQQDPINTSTMLARIATHCWAKARADSVADQLLRRKILVTPVRMILSCNVFDQLHG